MPSRGIAKTTLAVLIIVIIILAGAGSYYYYTTTTSTSTSTTLSGHITIAAETGYNDAALKQIASDFMAAYPGTTVTVDTLSFDTALQSYETAFSANQSTYDVIFFPNVGYIGSIQQYLLDLNPYVSNTAYFPTSWNMSDILPSMIAPFQIGGHLYAIPNTGDVMLFFYRPSFFNNVTNQAEFKTQYGYALPNPGTTTLTLQQTVDVANFFNGQHGSKYGIEFMTGPGDDDMIQTFLTLLGGARTNSTNTALYGSVTAPYGDMFSSSGQLLSNTPMFQGVLSDFVQLIHASEDPLTATFTTVPGTFEAGDSPMMLYWSYPVDFLGNATQSKVANDWAVAPTTPGGVSETGGVGLGVFKYTQNLKLSLTFLEFATNSKESLVYTTVDSLVPFRYSDFKQVPTSVLPTALINEILTSLKTSVQGPANIAVWPQVSTYFRGEVPNIYSGSETVAQGASKITANCVSAGATAFH